MAGESGNSDADLEGVRWFVDEVVGFRERFWIKGWAYHPAGPVGVVAEHDGQPVRHATEQLPSPDLEVAIAPDAKEHRFTITGELPAGGTADRLEVVLRRGCASMRVTDLIGPRLQTDPFHALERRFYAEADRRRLLEIGSRARSGNSRRERFTGEYVGLDIVEGPNVDVVGDAHRLSTFLEPGSFGAIYTLSVFEHLAMPWKVAVEMNRILEPGGIAFIGSHHSFPLHDVPWDFFRFSEASWTSLFNAATGFEVVATAYGEPASIVPNVTHPIVGRTHEGLAYMLSGALVRKTGEATVDWDVPLASLIVEAYPH